MGATRTPKKNHEVSKFSGEKCVYLLVGQRGSGKSYFANRLLTNQSDLVLVSRDEILVRKFGSTDTSPYGGERWYAGNVLDRLLRFILHTRTNVGIILDCWTGDSAERASVVRKLREYGATRVVAIYFLTPLEAVNSWFWLKPGIAKFEEMGKHGGEKLVYFSPTAPAHDYELFHRLAKRIDHDGFDAVLRIDPSNEDFVTLDQFVKVMGA